MEKKGDLAIKRGTNIGYLKGYDRISVSLSDIKRLLAGSMVTIKVLMLKNSKIFPFDVDFPLISKIYFPLYTEDKKVPLHAGVGHKRTFLEPAGPANH